VRRIPVLPVRDTVLFPHAVLPLTVGRESSIQLIESMGEARSIIVATQLDPRLDAPKPEDLHTVGTLATVHKVVRMPNQSRFVFTEGVERVRLVRYVQTEPFMIAEVETLQDEEPAVSSSVEALVRNVVGQFQQIVAESATLSDELRTIVSNIEEPSRLVDFVASSLPFLTTDDKQALLENASIVTRLEILNSHLAKELEVQQLRAKIQTEVQDQVQQSQRDYSKPFKRSWASRTRASARPRSCGRKSRPPACRRTSKPRRSRSFRGCRACLPWPPTTRSPATTSSGWRFFPGPKVPAPKSISPRPRRFWTRTTTS
jgi:ATP-dependent Lon protease